MKTLAKPTIQELEALKGTATNNGKTPKDEWIATITSSYRNVLKHDPRQYRSFGPFWWLLKRELIACGINDFGDHLDMEWIEITDYKDMMLNILAAWAYAEFASEQQGLLYSNTHSVTFIEDSGASTSEYTLIDEEMEVLAWKK